MNEQMKRNVKLYTKAMEDAMRDEWVYEECSTKNCWCACVRTKNKFKSEEEGKPDHVYIIKEGAVTAGHVGLIVYDHNRNL